MTLSVHQPQYWPYAGYFHKILKSDCFVFLDTVQYKHREFQNRNRIRTDRGELWLTVPVKVKGRREQSIAVVEIDAERDWQGEHFKSICTWFANAPHFKRYLDFLEDLYCGRSWRSLCDLNVHICRFVLDELKIERPVYMESELKTTLMSTGRIVELCKKCEADIYLSGSGGKAYMEEGLFEREGIKLEYQRFEHPRYRQQFMKNEDDFVPYMSVLDLLLNEGPQRAREVMA